MKPLLPGLFADLADDTRRLACLQLLLIDLPTPNRHLLQALFFFLKKVRLFACPRTWPSHLRP